MTKHVPKVSAILNAYNGEAYLSQAIESVLAQTYEDWELIIWDNGSVDRTNEIARSYTDPRIRLLHSEDLQSLGKVRSYALREARGEWVAFIDHDDIWYPRKLELQVDLANDSDVGIIYGRSVRFSDRGYRRDFDHRHEFTDLPEGNILEALIAEGSFFTMSCAMLRRAPLVPLLEELESVDLCQDYFLFLNLAERYTARSIDQPICHYRIHSGNISRVRAARMHREILRLIHRWEDKVDAKVVRTRRRVFQTNLAVAELRQPSRLLAAIVRVLRHGSIAYLLSRPSAKAIRAMRRKLRVPRWRCPYPLPAEQQFKFVPLLGTKVCASSFQTAIEEVDRLVKLELPACISAANAYSLSLGISDHQYRSIVNRAAFTTADGMPLVWLLKLLGYGWAERVHNDDLFFACCERHPEWRHFFVGGRDGQSESLVSELQKRYPDMSIVGHAPTPVRPVPAESTEAILQQIHACKPSIIWVGMGTPAQDLWIDSVIDRVQSPMVGVGSLFDLVTGRTRPAPEWMKRAGAQWLYRLSQEPRRLTGRYLKHNTIFLIGAIRQLLADRRHGQAVDAPPLSKDQTR